jgi:diguanylate cyclase (GGDEF)-like protein
MADGSPEHREERDAPYLQQLIRDSLDELSPAGKGLFLQKFLKSLAGVEVSEEDCISCWEGILGRQIELSERLGRRISLVTAAADYFHTAEIFGYPALIDYQDLKRLRRDAATDPLTGLYNRRMFDETFAKELSRARRQVSPLTLLLFDMRDFKRMNDTYGHARGDQFLGCFARAATETIRRSDYAFRIGGDEFAVLLPESDIENGHGLAKRTDERFQRYALGIAPVVMAKLDYGLASFPDNGDTLEKLFEVADRALYAEKNLRPSFVAEPAAQIQIAPATPDGLGLPATDTTRPEFAPHPEAAEAQKQKRRHTRVSMEGMDARGVLHDGPIGDKEVRLLDLAFGGIGFLLEESTPVPELFSARLHVPPFNDVDLRFRRVYTRPQEAGILRVGASIAN